MLFKNDHRPIGTPEHKTRQTNIHTNPEVLRIYKNYPDLWWNDPQCPVFSRTPSEKIPPHLRKGVCWTMAVTTDRSVYECVTRIESGPATAILETSVTRWILKGGLKEGTPESWSLKLISEQGWKLVPRYKIGSKSPHKNGEFEKQHTQKELDSQFGTQFLKHVAERKQAEFERVQALQKNSKSINKLVTRTQAQEQAIEDLFQTQLRELKDRK